MKEAPIRNFIFTDNDVHDVRFLFNIYSFFLEIIFPWLVHFPVRLTENWEVPTIVLKIELSQSVLSETNCSHGPISGINQITL